MRPLKVLSLTVLIAAIATGCVKPNPPRTLIVASGTADRGTWVDRLTSCHRDRAQAVHLDPDRPLTLFVPGAYFTAGGFEALANVFEAHGQQTLCFNYDDRERLEVASTQLVVALEALERFVPRAPITVFGHSQGGLIGRNALVRDRYRPLRAHRGLEIVLVTVAAPFQGITSAKTCGMGWLHIITFGMTAGICQSVAGSKWVDIFPGSRFMRHPGSLGSFVKRHVMIVTDERGACLRRARGGECEEEDQTFGLDEQYSKIIEADRRVDEVEVKAGHSAILGKPDKRPDTLIRVLEKHEILKTATFASSQR